MPTRWLHNNNDNTLKNLENRRNTRIILLINKKYVKINLIKNNKNS